MPLTKTLELTRMLCFLKKLALEVIVQAPFFLACESKLEGGMKLINEHAFACKRTSAQVGEKYSFRNTLIT